MKEDDIIIGKKTSGFSTCMMQDSNISPLKKSVEVLCELTASNGVLEAIAVLAKAAH